MRAPVLGRLSRTKRSRVSRCEEETSVLPEKSATLTENLRVITCFLMLGRLTSFGCGWKVIGVCCVVSNGFSSP